MTDRPKVHELVFAVGEMGGTASLSSKVRVGDHVEEGQLLADIETDKVAYELVAPVAGKLVELVADGEFDLGLVVARIEEDVSRRRPPPAPSPPPAPAPRPARVPTSPPSIELGSVGRRIDLRALDARIASLGTLTNAEAAAHAVRVVRGCAVVPELIDPSGLVLAYVAVHRGVEARTVLRLAVHHDEAEVEVLPRDAPVDLVVVRFHDAIEGADTYGHPWRIVIGAPHPVPARDASGAITLVPLASLTIELPRAPARLRRLLAALTEQLERGTTR